MNTNIFERWIYEHSKYKKPFDQLVAEIEMVLKNCPPFVYPLLGDSRTGKTTLLQDVEAFFANRLSASGHPLVIRIPMPAAASNEALAVRIIKKLLNDEGVEVKGKTYQILDRARDALKNAGVLVVLLEEINHQVEKRSSARAQTKDNRMAADWFKELLDTAGVSIVISGLTHVKRMYIDNNQLQNRGLRGVTLSAYAWGKPTERAEFINVVTAAIGHFEDNGWTVQASQDLVARVAYYGSGGYVGRAVDFFKRIDTSSKGYRVLSEASLTSAFNAKFTVDWPQEEGDFQPFFNDVLLQKAHQDEKDRALFSGGKGASLD